jgi:hypothetical protein
MAVVDAGWRSGKHHAADALESWVYCNPSKGFVAFDSTPKLWNCRIPFYSAQALLK